MEMKDFHVRKHQQIREGNGQTHLYYQQKVIKFLEINMTEECDGYIFIYSIVNVL